MLKKFIIYYYFILFEIENDRCKNREKKNWATPFLQLSLLYLPFLFIFFFGLKFIFDIDLFVASKLIFIVSCILFTYPVYYLLFRVWEIRYKYENEGAFKFTLTKKDKTNAYIIFFISLILLFATLALAIYVKKNT